MVEEAGQPAERSVVVIHVEDRLLLQKHLRGDPDAFGLLVDRLGGAVWALICRSGVRGPDREDVYQEVFVKVHRAAHIHQPDRPLKPWVLTIAVNTARSWHRNKKVRKLLHLSETPERAGNEPSAYQVVEAEESAGWMQQRIAALPEAQREVLLMCSVEGIAQKDAAELLALPLNTVKTHLRRARLSLAADLQRRQRDLEREAGR
jgi:RNA polymerase sigma factor (sigma-70 family)